jgi:hypothetical protein
VAIGGIVKPVKQLLLADQGRGEQERDIDCDGARLVLLDQSRQPLAAVTF